VKVLLIDDETLDVFVAKKLLGLEFEVEGFTSPEEALTWAKANTFDVVLIDYYLGTNLYAHNILQELIAFKGRSFKAFVLSNYVDEKQSRELLDAGFNDIIEKPFSLEKFKVYLAK
jgi:CheY-like chemotaxis protein